MNYKAGDTVRIRSREWMNAQEKLSNGDIQLIDNMRGHHLTHLMQEQADKVAKITEVLIENNGFLAYRLNISGKDSWNVWENWMFDPDYRADGPLSPKDAVIAMIRESVRRDFAEKAVAGICYDNWYLADTEHVIAKKAFDVADAMLAEWEKEAGK